MIYVMNFQCYMQMRAFGYTPYDLLMIKLLDAMDLSQDSMQEEKERNNDS